MELGKDEISRGFKGRNFGVGCPGGVEAVAHSLRDTLQKHRKSGFALLKIDFKNTFNLLNREALFEPPRRCFLGWNGGLGGAITSHLCWFTITKGSSFLSQEFSKVTLWVPCT